MVFQTILQNLIDWVISHGLRVVGILFFAGIVIRVIEIFIFKLINVLATRGEKVIKKTKIEKERMGTLVNVINSTIKIIIWTIALLMILPEFGINIAPLLAGAGIVGLAIGMGSRNLVQDYLSGFFILLEDQYRVNEEIKVANIQGKVKEFNLRMTILEDADKNLHYIPNGQIKMVSNLSRLKKD